LPWTLTPILLRTIFAFIFHNILFAVHVLLNVDADAIVVAVKGTSIMECVVPATEIQSMLIIPFNGTSSICMFIMYTLFVSRLRDKNRIKEALDMQCMVFYFVIHNEQIILCQNT
jgi:uncharacterized membrane protein